jgi:hypothetical protein
MASDEKRIGLALVEEGWSAEPDVDEVRALRTRARLWADKLRML